MLNNFPSSYGNWRSWLWFKENSLSWVNSPISIGKDLERRKEKLKIIFFPSVNKFSKSDIFSKHKQSDNITYRKFLNQNETLHYVKSRLSRGIADLPTIYKPTFYKKQFQISVGNNRKLFFVWINYLILLLVKSNFLRFHNLAIHAGNTWILLSFKYRAVKCVHLNINGLKFLTPQLISSSCQLVPFPAACSSWNNLKKMNDANFIFFIIIKKLCRFLNLKYYIVLVLLTGDKSIGNFSLSKISFTSLGIVRLCKLDEFCKIMVTAGTYNVILEFWKSF